MQYLTLPFFNPINAFDGEKGGIIQFSVLDCAVITSYTYKIYNNGSLVFSSGAIAVTDDIASISVRNFNITINQGVLANNLNYQIQVIISNPSLAPNKTSLESNFGNFACYSTPTFDIQWINPITLTYQTLVSGTTIKSDKIYLQLVFGNEDNDLNSPARINSANIVGYGITRESGAEEVIFQGDTLFNQPLQQVLTGLSLTNTSDSYYETYKIIASGTTIDGFNFSAEVDNLLCSYSLITNSPQFKVSNLPCKGLIEIQSNLTDYVGTSNPTSPTYPTAHTVDLSNPTSWVQWQDYFSTKQPYTFRLWVKDLNQGEIIGMLLTTDENQNVVIKYVTNDEYGYLTLEAYSLVDNNGILVQGFPYYIESNRLLLSDIATEIASGKYIYIGLQQNNNLYEIKIDLVMV